MSHGYLAFVMHAHIPYVRKHGMWPFGEEWLYEVITESYIPLIKIIENLEKRGKKAKFTVNITPVLAEQMADEYINKGLLQYLYRKIDVCAKDKERHADYPNYRKLAEFYERYYHDILSTYKDLLNENIISYLKELDDRGTIEIITSAATHAYLPLIPTEHALKAQIRMGIKTFKKHFRREPNGFWLPECGYMPSKNERKGIEEHLAEENIKYFFVDHHTIEGGKSVGTYMMRFPFLNERIAPEEEEMRDSRHTSRPYYLRTSKGNISVFGRNKETSLQVWSGEWGYPGDGWYREFHKRDALSGLQYWRVTDKRKDLGTKELYVPMKTEERLEENSYHFVDLVSNVLKRDRPIGDGIVVAPYDAELFGHWWFEGCRWLEKVIMKCENVTPITCSEYLEKHPPEEIIDLPESSWGAGGKHQVWQNENTSWIWVEIKNAEDKMIEVLSRGEMYEKEMKQMMRELMLMESSDWPFLIFTKQAEEYAIQRFRNHSERFNNIYNAIITGTKINIEGIYDMDNLFDDIDITMYSP